MFLIISASPVEYKLCMNASFCHFFITNFPHLENYLMDSRNSIMNSIMEK